MPSDVVVTMVPDAPDVEAFRSRPDHPEPMHFARGLPLAKALHRDTLLALRMNGEPLTPSHGFPLRLLVPGWYGVASVKWLTRLEASRVPFRGYFQTVKYTIKRHGDGGQETVPLQDMAVKSEIVRPFAGEALGLGKQRVFGLAWAGEEAGGQRRAEHRRRPSRGAKPSCSAPGRLIPGRCGSTCGTFSEAGSYELLSRATSVSGRVQPTRVRSALQRLHDPFQPADSRARRIAGRPATPPRATSTSLRYDMNAFAEANARRPLDVDLEFSLGAGI